MSYKSPIEIAITQMHREQEKWLEENIFSAIHEVGITINKEQLIKALQYDRDQYKKGYNDGYDEGFDRGYDADKWLSVEEGLPPMERGANYYCPDSFVLVATKDGKVFAAHYSHPNNCFWYKNSLTPLKDITHWQPLPAPPTEKPYD